jgi:LDH2 family malate/lactate/ureidoglycolate dehydrogenase
MNNNGIAADYEIDWVKVTSTELLTFINSSLRAAGADWASAEAVSQSLVGASSRGVDSHGLRLLPHYLNVLQNGRINGNPQITFKALSASTGTLNGDDCFGHLAGYRAIEEGIKLADKSGMGAVTVINSSHFGAAGSYSLLAAEQGYIALVVSNSDKLVLAHDGVAPFHGTNPISFAAPVKDQNPYLLDMATSSIPYNRVLHYQSIDRPLPKDVAVDGAGDMTTDPLNTEALLPLGGRGYGYKGAALAGMCEVLCSALTGMAFSHQLLAINGPDLSTPRHLGHFFLVMKPEAFIDPDIYADQLSTYLADLREQSAVSDAKVMAPGDREWDVQQKRQANGIPIDPPLWENLKSIAAELNINPLQ